MNKSLKYVFEEVDVVPRCDEKYFVLTVDGVYTKTIYSESHLKKCLSILDAFVAYKSLLMKVYVVYTSESFDFRICGVYLRKKVVNRLYDGHHFVKVVNLTF